ncbi:hypothetical protein GP486_008998 [Trichoglossum hirsutum]|uniref:Uncharacterized protein n=1 Tax=Trichoglossum hirsutum TaxID=265104 RepID=A0A9P8KZ08_9PEZI|nr:hypothetical protein GP486_008998 [Trichoglossum hirsutum]
MRSAKDRQSSYEYHEAASREAASRAAWAAFAEGASSSTRPTSSPTKSEQAIKHLNKEYSNVLDQSDMVSAMEVMENNVKAAIFLCMEEGDTRDAWLVNQIRRVNMMG